MLTNRARNVSIEGKDIRSIIFRNFAGGPDNFNPQGCMPNFTLVLNNDKAKELEERGLNVRYKENRDGDEEAHLKVFMRYDNYPPHLFRVTGKSTVELTEETARILDQDEIEDADLIISPYAYEFGGRNGVKAYLSKGYFTVAEDQFSQKYARSEEEDLPF